MTQVLSIPIREISLQVRRHFGADNQQFEGTIREGAVVLFYDHDGGYPEGYLLDRDCDFDPVNVECGDGVEASFCKLGVSTPLGQALLNQKVGDKFVAKLDRGLQRNIEILAVG